LRTLKSIFLLTYLLTYSGLRFSIYDQNTDDSLQLPETYKLVKMLKPLTDERLKIFTF